MGIQFRCGRCAAWQRGGANGAVVACDRCGHRNVCPQPSPTRPAAPPPAEDRATSFPWLWVVCGGGLIAAACVVWLSYGLTAVRADVPAAASTADVRQLEILKANLNRPGDPELERIYQAVNMKHFSGELPIMPVRWEPALASVGALAKPPFTLEGLFGRIGKRTIILLNPAVRASPGSLERSLCHEMVHAYLYTHGDLTTNHGAHFKAELGRLSAEGAFEGISASEEEKTALRVWLDAESARIDAERKDVETTGAELWRDRADLDRDVAASPTDTDSLETRRVAYNQRVAEMKARIDQGRVEVDHFNREAARYNLMISYPDGQDEASVRSKPVTPAASGR